jgi:hypothetical protein
VLYLKFQKYACLMFFVLMLINCGFLIPLYYSGQPLEGQHLSSLSELTILNLFGTQNKVWYSFASVFINSVGAYIIIYKFWKGTVELKIKRHEMHVKFTQREISKHTIMIKGIPKSLDPVKTSQRLFKIFERTY